MAIHVGLLLAQAGEFAFALTSIVFVGGLLAEGEAQVLFLATAMSLVLTPGLAAIGARVDRKLESRGLPGFPELSKQRRLSPNPMSRSLAMAAPGRLWRACSKPRMSPISPSTTRQPGWLLRLPQAIRCSTQMLAGIRRLDMMGLESVRLAIVAMGDAHSGADLVMALKRRRPDLPIYARARGQEAQSLLRNAAADVVVREVAESSLHMGGAILRGLGREREDVAATIDAFREDEYRALSAFSRFLRCPAWRKAQRDTNNSPDAEPNPKAVTNKAV